ncbi:uncharacterized protein E0L32_000282 [Thyridium curvatum]|uniref:Aminoglycoside phosphotransferase domain-containing protein n=1 Tax=Thyridium curvatum TaxID=1093900 RepID=A0A507BGV1_9PEZI|nr:uncharacterized protein E0L32_000282 [Thyridium curvatum]TPX15948.1 hypothetical protein E0L32_000282 [Thyridium curvatum]
MQNDTDTPSQAPGPPSNTSLALRPRAQNSESESSSRTLSGSALHSQPDAPEPTAPGLPDDEFEREEPIFIYQFRVFNLCTKTLFPSVSLDNLEVDEVGSGGYNRIIKITAKYEEGESRDAQSVILRVPRYEENEEVEDVVAISRFLQRKIRIPTPRVLAFDVGKDNVLESAYTVMEFVPGITLESVWPRLCQRARFRVASELGEYARLVLQCRSSAAGRVAAADTVDEICLANYPGPPWEEERPKLSRPYRNAPPEISVLDTLMEDLREAEARALGSEDQVLALLFRQLMNMAEEMDRRGFFFDHFYSLTHVDFQARNIMADIKLGQTEGLVSAIIDWDDAIFAPMILACAPPVWLWNDWGPADLVERADNIEPTTAEYKEIKEAFDTAAGEDYRRWAYGDGYRLARRLIRFSIEGVRWKRDWTEAEEMLEEWRVMYQTRVYSPSF